MLYCIGYVIITLRHNLNSLICREILNFEIYVNFVPAIVNPFILALLLFFLFELLTKCKKIKKKLFPQFLLCHAIGCMHVNMIRYCSLIIELCYCIYPSKSRAHINTWARINAGVQFSEVNKYLCKIQKGLI